MTQNTPSKTDLRKGFVQQVRRPRTLMQPLSPEELHVLCSDAPEVPRGPGLPGRIDSPRSD